MLDSSTDAPLLTEATMGCTSSAPGMAPNATENNIDFSRDMQENEKVEMNNIVRGVTETNAVIENEVLPMCDNLDESKHLSQTDMSRIHSVSQRIDKDVQTDSFRIDNDWNESCKIFEEEDKLSKLEEVVEQAVEKLSQASSENVAESAIDAPAELAGVARAAASDPDAAHAPDDTEAVVEEDYEHLEEAISPSQSESSRATRWEALADIAAELPPSLAVDPLTGQIYTLK